MSLLDFQQKRALGRRVPVGGYYTDGGSLVEVVAIGATGCVVFRDSVTGAQRCLAIEDFRRGWWIVRGPGVEQAA